MKLADNSWIVMLVIVALSAISNWVQKRGKSQEGDLKPGEGTAPRPPHSPRRADEPAVPGEPPSGQPLEPEWARQLRQLLEGDEPPPSPPVRPPPVLVPEPRPAPTPPPIRTAPRLAPVPVATVSQPEEGHAISPATLSESSPAYKKAQQLHQQTADRMREVDEQIKLHRTRTAGGHRRAAPEDIAAAIAMVREPQSARRALINSIILGPPKALEN